MISVVLPAWDKCLACQLASLLEIVNDLPVDFFRNLNWRDQRAKVFEGEDPNCHLKFFKDASLRSIRGMFREENIELAYVNTRFGHIFKILENTNNVLKQSRMSYAYII